MSATAGGGSGQERLDLLLLELGLAESRQKARALIMAGAVLVNDKPADKPGHRYPRDAAVRLRDQGPGYVSRGGLKLAAALDAFELDPAGMTALDVGVSTGGFTDCLLQRGAQRVFGVDVGRAQVAWALRKDPRVVLFEGTNFRGFDPGLLPAPVDLVTIDVSFISLRHMLPVAVRCLKPSGWLLPMVKPQFEVGPERVGKGGVVRDPAVRAEAVASVRALAQDLELQVLGEVPTGVPGPKGNMEFFLCLRRSDG